MTGLDLVADALIEVAALVTDFDLNVLGDGIDIVIKPPGRGLEQMDQFVRTMHERSGLLDELAAGLTLEDAEAAGARLHQAALPRRQPAAAGGQHRRDRPRVPGPRHGRPSSRSCTTGSSTSPRSRSCRGAGTPAPTSTRRPSAATTGRWPTSRRASRSCATTARRSSCRRPGPTATRRRRWPPSTAARSPGSPDRPRWRRHGFRGRAQDPSRLLSGLARRGLMVGVAQLVERRVVVADVAGSSPVIHPKYATGPPG